MSDYPLIGDDDGTCQASPPGQPEVRCIRRAGHGPGDMHDGIAPEGLCGVLWPNPAQASET